MKKFTTDFSKCNQYIDGSYDEVLQKSLKQKDFYGEDFLYSIFNERHIEQIKSTGNYRQNNPNSIFALTIPELVWENDNTVLNDVQGLTNSYLFPAIAIYDKEQFKEECQWEYRFKNPDKKLEALLGVMVMKNLS